MFVSFGLIRFGFIQTGNSTKLTLHPLGHPFGVTVLQSVGSVSPFRNWLPRLLVFKVVKDIFSVYCGSVMFAGQGQIGLEKNDR